MHNSKLTMIINATYRKLLQGVTDMQWPDIHTFLFKANSLVMINLYAYPKKQYYTYTCTCT